MEAIGARDPGALPTFETMLAATGFRWEDDYTDSAWAETLTVFYRVVVPVPPSHRSRRATRPEEHNRTQSTWPAANHTRWIHKWSRHH